MHRHKLKLELPMALVGPAEGGGELLDEQLNAADGAGVERDEGDGATGDSSRVERAGEVIQRPRVRPVKLLPRGVVREQALQLRGVVHVSALAVAHAARKECDLVLQLHAV